MSESKNPFAEMQALVRRMNPVSDKETPTKSTPVNLREHLGGWRGELRKKYTPHTLQGVNEDFSNLAPQEQERFTKEIKDAVGVEITITQSRQTKTGAEISGTMRLSRPLSFLMTTLTPNGFYISCDNLPLDEKGLEALGRLRTYFGTWYEQQVKGSAGGSPNDAPVDTTQAQQGTPPLN